MPGERLASQTPPSYIESEIQLATNETSEL